MAAVAIVMRSSEPVVLSAGGMAVGYIGAAFFPIDADTRSSGTVRYVLHALAACVEYVGAMGAFDIVGRELGFPYTAVKFAILGFFVSMYVTGLRRLRGLLQRVIEIVMLIGLGAFVLRA
ncbi:MAG TPA: hypothetical protein VK629_05495 [Steroidobacteraceae bacterium]|nr:hypothetical protein [Steroidobacteraceae bacterium]